MNLNVLQRRYVVTMTRLLHRRYLQQLKVISHAGKQQQTTTVNPLMTRHYKPIYTKANARNESPDSHNINDAVCTFDDDSDEHLVGKPLQSLLYTSPDAVMDDLNSSRNYNELIDKVIAYAECDKERLQREHLVQTVILVWSFCMNLSDEDIATTIKSREDKFKKFLELLHTRVPALTIEELSCCYLYLRRLGLANSEKVVEDMLIRALDEIEETTHAKPISLFALSRLSAGITHGRDFFTPLVCIHFVPHIKQHLLNCRTDTEARQLAICMYNLQPLIDNDDLESFKSRIHQLIQDGVINENTLKAIHKLLQMFNMPSWSKQNSTIVRELLVVLQSKMDELNDKELRNISRIFQFNLEPASLGMPLKRATEKLLRAKPSAEALACYLPFAEPQKRDVLIRMFKKLLAKSESWHEPNASSDFFTILRSLKISDRKICDAYWQGLVSDMLDCTDKDLQQIKATRHAHRYMNFNNNLGGTYRYEPFEKALSQVAMDVIEGDIAGRIPNRFSRLAAFVFAYGWTPFAWKKFPNVLLTKIIQMAEQFSPIDCHLISRGLQIALEMRFRQHLPPIVGMQIATIDNVLLSCAERHLNNSENLTLSDLNLIVRSLTHNKALKNSSIYQQAFNTYKTLECANELNSRTIREMVYSFNTSHVFVPEMLEKIFTYIENNHEHVMGDTVEKVLSCSYNLGYMPQSMDVLHHAANILMRDFNYMSGLAIVQACLALCFYKTIPDELINRVFCVAFIQRIEEEIQMCYSKATYPERVLNQVMQLNRTVCLDFPEANVPWFQQNYLEAHLSKKPFNPTEFSSDVGKLLETILRDKQYFRCNHTTPYGYQIDFVIHFDQNKKPITPEPVEATMLDRITKVAILLLKLDSFCENDLTSLRGPQSLKITHLEMMGYKVLHINEHDWNSKYMNAPGAKENYLKCLLQITN